MKKKRKDNQNILLTCANRKVHILNLLTKTFPQKKIYISDQRKEIVSKYFSKYFWHSPKFVDKNFTKILNYLKKKKITFIFPTSDSELKFWSKYRLKLKKNNIFVMVSDLETIEICLDKLKFFKLLEKNSIPAIKTSTNINSINAKRFVVKNRFGSGNKNCFLNLSKNRSIKYSKNIAKPIFQKFINGKEVSIDCYIGKKNKIILRFRDLINNGESEKTTIFKNKKISIIINNIIQLLNFKGHIMFQGFIKSQKIFYK